MARIDHEVEARIAAVVLIVHAAQHHTAVLGPNAREVQRQTVVVVQHLNNKNDEQIMLKINKMKKKKFT